VLPVAPVVPPPDEAIGPVTTIIMNRSPLLAPATCVSANWPIDGPASVLKISSVSASEPAKQATVGGEVNPPSTSAAAPASIVTVKAPPSPAPASVIATTT
jgi:hypothetical protein